MFGSAPCFRRKSTQETFPRPAASCRAVWFLKLHLFTESGWAADRKRSKVKLWVCFYSSDHILTKPSGGRLGWINNCRGRGHWQRLNKAGGSNVTKTPAARNIINDKTVGLVGTIKAYIKMSVIFLKSPELWWMAGSKIKIKIKINHTVNRSLSWMRLGFYWMSCVRVCEHTFHQQLQLSIFFRNLT